MLTLRVVVSVAIACGACSLEALGQTYPAKPVRMIVGYPPASGVDIAARLVTAKLTEAHGVQFLVDNRPGAAGNIAVELTARAAA